MLSEYFKPLSLSLILFSALFFVYFDAVGVYVDHLLIKSPKFLRPAFWIYGIGVIVFIWFILRFFVPLKPPYVIASFAPLFIWSLPHYIKNRSWESLILFIRKNSGLLVPLIIIFPILLIKSSLPPYLTDEMQYHFLSPFDTYNSIWKLDHQSVHPSLPKELDLFFAIPFSLTKTYAPSRLLHFAIFYSAISAIYAWFKSRISAFSSIVFLILFLFLHHDLPIVATSGYIDYSTAALSAVGVVTMLEFMLTKDTRNLYASFVFSAISFGSKYPSLVPFLASTVLLTVWFIKTKHYRVIKITNIIRLTLLTILFGGYWYIKNWIYTGNPLFPFLGNIFKCDQALCLVTSGIFGITTPITFSGLPSIAIGITKGHSLYLLLLLPALILILKSKSSSSIKTALFLLSSSLLSFVIIKYFTGYVDRYFYFLQIILALSLSVPLSFRCKPTLLKHLHQAYIVLLLTLVGYYSLANIRRIYSIKSYISPQEIRYALGKTDIYDWLKDRHRVTGDIYKWCGEPGKKELILTDEHIIRKAEDGWTYAFNVNCKLSPIEFYEPTPQEELEFLIKQNKRFFFADRENCRKPEIFDKSRKDDYGLFRQEIRNLLICNSTETVKNIYLFDPAQIAQKRL